MEKLGGFMSIFWKWLDGNKTIICMLVFGFIKEFGVEIGMSPMSIQMILWAAGTLGLGSFGHHIKKGKLTTKSN